MSYLFLIAGFVLLIKGADILIDSSAKLAHILAIPSFIIGFSVIAFGTSAPELAVGVFSGFRQANLITLGDVIGSCIVNIALIAGVTAVIYPLDVEKSVLKKDIPISFAVQLLLTGLLLMDGRLSRIDAAILLVLFVAFLFYIFKRAKGMERESTVQGPADSDKLKLETSQITGMPKGTNDSERTDAVMITTAEYPEGTVPAGNRNLTDTATDPRELEKQVVMEEETEAGEAEELLEAAAEMKEANLTDVQGVKEHSALKLAGLILLSLVGIIGGADLIVNSSIEIARMLGMSEVMIGITVVAVGTSLPELVTSIVAALKRQSELAIGNIIGSNIFNVLFVLGTSALIHPIPAVKGIEMDTVFMLAATLAILFLPLRRKRISKAGGCLLLLLYALFMTYKVLSA